MEATGSTGTITYTAGIVTIQRRSFVGGGGEVRTYRLADIGNLDYRPASFVEPGFIRVLGVGVQPSASSAHDRNAVGFRSDQQQSFIELYRILYKDLYGIEPAEEMITAQTPAWMLAVALVLIVLFTIYIWFPVVSSLF